MSQETNHINCPNCDFEIDVQEILTEQVEDQLEKKYQKQLSESLDKERAKTKAIEAKVQAEREALVQQQEEYQSKLESAVSIKVKAEKDKLEVKLKKKLQDDQAEMLESLQKELNVAKTFPLDTIGEIKKGANGADCVQTVNTMNRQNCGSILYESKRTKSFQPAWIEKFKTDLRAKKATIGVLVTQVMPTDMKRMGQKSGIWICTFEEFKGLSKVLRESIIQLDTALITQDNKGDKMGMLYDFLTGSEFRMQVEAIVSGFTEMETDLIKEKRAMQKIWSQRQKQIDKVIGSTIGMYGSIKGIAGNAIEDIPLLELGED